MQVCTHDMQIGIDRHAGRHSQTCRQVFTDMQCRQVFIDMEVGTHRHQTCKLVLVDMQVGIHRHAITGRNSQTWGQVFINMQVGTRRHEGRQSQTIDMQLQVDLFIIYDVFVFKNKQYIKRYWADWVLIIAFFLRPRFFLYPKLIKVMFQLMTVDPKIKNPDSAPPLYGQ